MIKVTLGIGNKTEAKRTISRLLSYFRFIIITVSIRVEAM